MCLSAWLVAVTCVAVPAKKGFWKAITLKDGTTVQAQLRGDEHLHFWETPDGKRYLVESETGRYIPADMDKLRQKANARKARVSQARAQRRVRIGGNHDPYIGKKKGLIILTQFKGQTFESGHDKSLYNEITNSPGFSRLGFNGSVHDYFLDQSDGKFDLTFDVVGPVTLSNTNSYYGQNGSDGGDLRPVYMIVEACRLVQDQVNFSDYDWDGDGEVDQVVVLYNGLGEAAGGDENTVWPHEYKISYSPVNNYRPLTLDGVRIDTYACCAEKTVYGYNEFGQMEYGISGIGTFCHEFSHCLGLPDMYDTVYGTEGNYGMSSWSVMDQGSYNGLTAPGFCPAAYTAYERMYAGWRQPIELKENVDIKNMTPISQGGNTYIIYNDATPNEYYLLENRQFTGWDTALEGNGLIVTHIDFDEDVWLYNLVNTTAKVEDVPIYNDHQRCHVIAADNSYGSYKTYVYDDGTEIPYYDYDDIDGDAFPYVKDNVVLNDSLTNKSIPRATWYNYNKYGNKKWNHSLLHITQNTDKTVSFSFRVADNPEGADEAEYFFVETFNNCEGTGGNDGLWSGSMVGQSTFIPDNNGWKGSSVYGANKCARLGATRGNIAVRTPIFAIDGTATIMFNAASWEGDNTTLQLFADDEDGYPTSDFQISNTNFTLSQGAWQTYSTTISGVGKLRLRFTPSKRFFLDELMVGVNILSDVKGVTVVDTINNNVYDLNGRKVGTSFQQLPKGVYIMNGKKYVIQ